jgi:hypothetical protein
MEEDSDFENLQCIKKVSLGVEGMEEEVQLEQIMRLRKSKSGI